MFPHCGKLFSLPVVLKVNNQIEFVKSFLFDDEKEE